MMSIVYSQYSKVYSHNVAARLADLRKHLACHPALERFRLRQMGGKNERIESALVDNHSLRLVVGTSVANRDGGFVPLICLCAAKGVTFRYSLVFAVHMVLQCLAGIAVAECRSHIPAHKEGLALLVRHGSDGAEHVVVEYL